MTPPESGAATAVGPIVEICRREEFSAAHRIHNPALSEAENDRLFGACHRTHGHNYVLEVWVRGPVDPRTGMVLNLVDLMALLRTAIVEEVDHRDLSRDVPFLEGIVITAETLSVAFWQRLQPSIEELGCELSRLRLYESESNFVEFRGEGLESRSTAGGRS